MGRLTKTQKTILYRFAEKTELEQGISYQDLPDSLVEKLEDIHMFEGMEEQTERFLDECVLLQEEGNF